MLISRIVCWLQLPLGLVIFYYLHSFAAIPVSSLFVSSYKLLEVYPLRMACKQRIFSEKSYFQGNSGDSICVSLWGFTFSISSCWAGVFLFIGFCGCFAFRCPNRPMKRRLQPTIKMMISMGNSRTTVSLLRFFLLVGFVKSDARCTLVT